MTIPTGDPNRPVAPVFDFGLGGPSTSSPDTPNEFGVSSRPRAELRRRSRVDSRSFGVPIVIGLVILVVAGGAAFAGWSLVQQSEAEVKADSAAFCANLAETPGVLDQPAFGWPTDGADLASTLELMKGYQARWEAIAAAAPSTIKPDVSAVAEAAAVITSGIETSKSIDRPATLQAMQRVTSATDIPAWANKYCN